MQHHDREVGRLGRSQRMQGGPGTGPRLSSRNLSEVHRKRRGSLVDSKRIRNRREKGALEELEAERALWRENPGTADRGMAATRGGQVAGLTS